MISVVTGTLNRLELLKKVISNTVDSDKRIELVIIDGGSTDKTVEYIKTLNHPQIKLIDFGKRSYYWDFMNLGIKESTHDFICQWNDDVVLENSWSEVIEQIDNEHDFYIFSWKENSGQNYILHESETELVLNYGLYRKKIFKEIGLYNNSYKYYYCDGDMSYRAKSFGYNYKKLDNIKCEVLTYHGQKNAFLENSSDELDNYLKHLELYRNQKLPENIELL